ncbi:serine hydrolase domain-containing protein [Dactylosporangium fulvum]|uniref:Beta-lactamase family protein n=1 Tax=Dactylosporangium fulvum TaxID=53359 RepID=A0ABY5W780_9ACTN|nr:serine hydrolase domain-containing protein [Dactylosporangium fulvum]UWP84553.1 beta-lactamase family protein [Dactylosporangium fulvum]
MALVRALDLLVPEILDHTDTPGVSIALGVGDEVVWTKGYGLADLATGAPMTPDTVNPIGSDAKTYTAAAAMQLVERGIVDLDGPIGPHLGGLRVVNPHGPRPITLRDLLTHRSGLGTTFGFTDRVPPAPLGEHLREVFRRGKSDLYGGSLVPLWSTPVGAQYQYSNTGLALVGYLVECANPLRVPFDEWVRRSLFTPLGMRSSWFPPAAVPHEALSRRSTGYASLGGFQFVLPQMYVADYPAGTALTTASDHCRFALAMLNEGALPSGRILSPQTARLMLTPQAGTGPDPAAAVGLVWNVFHGGLDARYVGHGGEYFWGWSNFTRGWPAQRVAVVVSANQWHLADPGSSHRPSHFAGRLIGGIVTAWVNGHDPAPSMSPAAAQSWVAGMMVADRLTTRIGAARPLTEAEIDALATGAVVRPGTPWDEAAFRAALRDFPAASLGEAMAWSREHVPAHLQALVTSQLGVPWLSRLVAGLDL